MLPIAPVVALNPRHAEYCDKSWCRLYIHEPRFTVRGVEWAVARWSCWGGYYGSSRILNAIRDLEDASTVRAVSGRDFREINDCLLRFVPPRAIAGRSPIPAMLQAAHREMDKRALYKSSYVTYYDWSVIDEIAERMAVHCVECGVRCPDQYVVDEFDARCRSWAELNHRLTLKWRLSVDVDGDGSWMWWCSAAHRHRYSQRIRREWKWLNQGKQALTQVRKLCRPTVSQGVSRSQPMGLGLDTTLPT